jgi:LacI family transcriptional regulator/LacI family repressor for deo operon, udp, cdd, tsx, nupC, and nupG
MTVSRVLQGRKEQVNDETYSRVLAAMHEMNYVPVRPVMQNRHVETNAIGLVPYYMNPSGNAIDSVTIEGLCEQAGVHGYDLYIMMRPEAEWMANREDLRFLDRRCDGFIFISPGAGEWQAGLESLVQHGIPTVVCYRRDVPEGVAWIDPDNEAIIRIALEHLMAHGHSRIAYFTGPRPSLQGKERLANLSGVRPNFDDTQRQKYFTQMMKEMGNAKWSEQILWFRDPEWKLSEEEAREFFDSGATAVICGDLLAMQLWDRSLAAGLCVPEDLSIVSIDGSTAAAHRGLTTISFGYDEIGRHAVKTWVELNAGQSVKNCCKVLPVRLTERASVAAPRRK